MKKLFFTIVLAILFLHIGCTPLDTSYYFYEISSRTNSLLKFNKAELDIFDYSLSAVRETVIDVSNADTAHRFLLTQIEYPGGENQRSFQTPVEFKDYHNFANALTNMLPTGQKTDYPLYYQAALQMLVKYTPGQGFALTDSAGANLVVPETQKQTFVDFVQSLGILTKTSPAADLAQKRSYIDANRKAQIARFKQKYRFRELALGKTTLKYAAKSAASDNWNVECIFYVSNPNAFDCLFDATFNLIGKKGGSIHPFKVEDFTVPANAGKSFSAVTVLKKFQAERLDFTQTQIYNVRTEDEVAKKYMK